MKKRNYFFLWVSVFVVLSACKKDFLEVENTEQIYRQVYVKDLKSMQEFVNGIYVVLSWQLEDGKAQAYPDLISDNFKLRSSTDQMSAHYSWTQITNGNDLQHFVANDVNGTAMDPLWRVGYKIIRACNFTIEEVDKYRGESTVKADDLKGQALAIRAYVHFKLVNTFAQNYTFTPNGSHIGVPYIATSDITKPYSRQTVHEVYDGMIGDLQSAIELLPESVTDTRYMNRNAARALLARAYLFKEDFVNAKKMAKEIADQFPLMRTPAYPSDIYKLKSPSQTESLFQLSPQNASNRADYLGRWLNYGTNRFGATMDIASILTETPNDVRKAWVNKISANEWNVLKFPSAVDPAILPAAVSYYPAVIRSSEMYLTLAEASAKSGDEITARSYLDSIRMRANASIAPVTATGVALIDSIYKERRKELAFEGLRMYDLQRWKLGVHRLDATGTFPKDLSYPNDKSIAPVPLNDIIIAKLEQNPSYN